MAHVSRRRIAKYVADEISRGSTKKDIVAKLAAFMVDHKYQHDVDFLIHDITSELASRGTYTFATITSARPLSSKERTDVESFIKKQSKVKAVELDEKVEPHLIGGIIIETPKARYDRSLRRGLEQLLKV